MRLSVLCSLVAVCAATLVTGGPATAAPPDDCAIAPVDYEVLSSGITSEDNERITFRYEVIATSTLDCPEGHPWDGGTIRIAERAALRLGNANSPSACWTTDEPSNSEVRVRGRTRDDVDITTPDMARSATFEGRIDGIIYLGPDGAECNLDLDVKAIGPNGSKLSLHELGTVDPVTGMLDSMGILSAEMVIFNP